MYRFAYTSGVAEAHSGPQRVRKARTEAPLICGQSAARPMKGRADADDTEPSPGGPRPETHEHVNIVAGFDS